MRHEACDSGKTEAAKKFDAWEYIEVRYNQRVLGPRADFYQMEAKDPVYGKLFSRY